MPAGAHAQKLWHRSRSRSEAKRRSCCAGTSVAPLFADSEDLSLAGHLLDVQAGRRAEEPKERGCCKFVEGACV